MQYVPNFGAKESFMFHVTHQHWQGMRVYWHNMAIDSKSSSDDMFTHTEHVESIALFEKTGAEAV